MPEQSNGDSQSNTAKKLRSRANLKPFGKGFDPRRNLKGRPKSFDEVRELAQQLAHETKNGRIAIERVLRQWMDSPEPSLQKAFVEYAFGKVPDKLEATGLENKPQIFLAYAHERQSSGQN